MKRGKLVSKELIKSKNHRKMIKKLMFSALNLHQCGMPKRLTLETSAPLPAYGVTLTLINWFEMFIYSLNCERLIRNGAFAVASSYKSYSSPTIMLGGC